MERKEVEEQRKRTEVRDITRMRTHRIEKKELYMLRVKKETKLKSKILRVINHRQYDNCLYVLYVPMYSGVPQKDVAPVEWSLTPSLDKPKSVSRTLPYWSSSTFSGLRSLRRCRYV